MAKSENQKLKLLCGEPPVCILVRGLGDGVKIVAPESVVAFVREEVTRLEHQYM